MSSWQRSSRVDWSFLSARGMRRCCGPLPKWQLRYPRKTAPHQQPFAAIKSEFPGVRTEKVVGRSGSAAKAFVGAGGVSPTGAESLIAFRRGGKWEYGRRFFLPGSDAPRAQHGTRLCDAPCLPTPRACSDDVDRRLWGWQLLFPAQAARRRAEKGRCCPERCASENGGNNLSNGPKRV